jgi:hypothetical protein
MTAPAGLRDGREFLTYTTIRVGTLSFHFVGRRCWWRGEGRGLCGGAFVRDCSSSPGGRAMAITGGFLEGLDDSQVDVPRMMLNSELWTPCTG